MDNGDLALRKWQVEPAGIARRRWESPPNGEENAVALYVSSVPVPNDTIIGEDTIGVNRFLANGMYYLHTDHLGSYCVITDSRKSVKQSNRFDAWGNPLDVSGLLGFALTRRGFTGHEHYPEFKIINMNARLYDPVIARFFSPDNFVQLPEFTQAFNRYSYCLNNPLKYRDPSGNRWVDEDDHYFTENGKYLGSDNSATDKIRIIEQEKWDKYGENISFKGEDGETMISQAAAHLLSKDLSEANLSNRAALNVFKHYNPTDYRLILGNGTSDMTTSGANKTIAVNIEKLNQLKSSDHFNEIKNIFSHERQHVIDFKKGRDPSNVKEWEQRAVKTQMADPTYPLTRPVFQKRVIRYGIDNNLKLY